MRCSPWVTGSSGRSATSGWRNSSNGGRTLFLVSHSEDDLRRFCTRGLYLRDGRLVGDGTVEEVLTTYRSSR